MKRASLLIFFIIVAGCHQKRTPVTALPPAPASAPVGNPLDHADAAFNAGNYSEAARGYETYLQRQGVDRRDHALFQLAMTYALSPVPDWTHASVLLKQVVDQYPRSPLKAPALLILSLQAELTTLNSDSQKRDQRIKQLTTELDKVKQIDADRRKKP